MDFDFITMKEIGYTILATIGGFLGYTVNQQEAGRKFVWRNASVQATGSGFVGFLVYMLCQSMGIDGPFVGTIIGVLSYLGVTATIQILKRFVHEKLGISQDEVK